MSDGDGEKTADGLSEAGERGLRALLDKLSGTHHFDFREYKEPTLVRRIRSRMSQVHVGSFETYGHFLDQHPEEYVALFNTILINVTEFFRDPEAWKIVADELIPRIVSGSGPSRSIRIWSAGCSSGEETYSVAMLLAEHLGKGMAEYLVKIYGTDLDEEALATARQAIYRLDQIKDVPHPLVEKYFTRDGQLYRVRRDLRRWCIFGAHNLTQAPPLSHIDMLVCRNVLIYFTSELQDRILSRFHYAVREDGYLFLGRSESLLARSRTFQPVQLKWRIFVRTPVSHQGSAAPADGEAERGHEPTDAAVRALSSPGSAQRALEAMPAAVTIIDTSDTVLSWNIAAEALFDVPVGAAVARKFRDLDVSYRVEGLRARIEEVKARHAAVRMDNAIFTRRNGETVHADISILPLFDARRLVGVLVFAAEATEHARLKEQMIRVAEQHATAIEELQSTNEELETTNEELQSTNEELETTNEELQSTNEELETTVEELQAANSELGTLNAELEGRTGELNRLDAFHRSLLDSLEAAIIVLDREGVVTAWNQTAERTWGLRSEHAVGRPFFALPIGQVSQQARAVFDAVVTTGEPADLPDVTSGPPGGTGHGVALRLQPLRVRTGEIVGAIAVLAELPIRPSGGR